MGNNILCQIWISWSSRKGACINQRKEISTEALDFKTINYHERTLRCQKVFATYALRQVKSQKKRPRTTFRENFNGIKMALSDDCIAMERGCYWKAGRKKKYFSTSNNCPEYKWHFQWRRSQSFQYQCLESVSWNRVLL